MHEFYFKFLLFNRCWLSVEKGTIWAFMGPVAVILTVSSNLDLFKVPVITVL